MKSSCFILAYFSSPPLQIRSNSTSYLQISHHNVFAQEGGADGLRASSNPFPEPTKQESNRAFRQRVPRLREKERLGIGTTLLQMFCLLQTRRIEIGQQRASSLMPEC